jgi:hypothetical protein
MTFKKGDPKPQSSGRRAGVRNKRTAALRGVLEAAAHEIGGLERLVQWIKADERNEAVFWSQMWIRLLPVKVEGTGQGGEIELSVQIKREDVAKALEDRGLPASIFGTDAPTSLN